MSDVKATGVLVMDHGTPRRLDDLPAFYTEIRRGRPPTPELLSDLERRYRAIGGISPLNERTDAQSRGIADALEKRAPGRFTVEHGAKFSAPRIEDAALALRRAGARRAVGLVLAPQSSVVSVGEYARRAIAAAEAPDPRGTPPMAIDVVDHWHTEPEVAELFAQRVERALHTFEPSARAGAVVVFTAHSVPARVVEAGDTYPGQVAATAAAVAEAAGLERWSVAYQSAGRTGEPWLGPDVLDVIAALGADGAGAVVVCPVGFVSDHLEILYDIDIEARAAAEDARIGFARTASLDDDPRFCALLARVVLERAGADGV